MLKVVLRLTSAAGAMPVRQPPPATPTLEKYEELAKDLVLAYESGFQPALERLNKHYGRSLTWEELRTGVQERLKSVRKEELPMSYMYEGYFALPHAQLLVARQAGFANWEELQQLRLDDQIPFVQVRSIPVPSPEDLGATMIQPVEMRTRFTVRLFDGSVTTTTDVWQMLEASRQGNFETVISLASECPALVRCAYNYMPPLHLAVREGHLELVRYLAELDTVNPKYGTDPYKESLIIVALDRGFHEIAEIFQDKFQSTDPSRPVEDDCSIDYEKDDERRHFEKLVSIGATAEVEHLLKKRPKLASDPFAFWSEGVLSVPANRRDHNMIDLLLRHGAQVPLVTKWGVRYYFKHYDIAEFYSTMVRMRIT